MKNNAIFPGTFDPPTLAHQNILEQAKAVFDNVTVVLANNSTKSPMYNLSHRLGMWQRLDEIPAVGFDRELITEVAVKLNCKFIIRGIRGISDIEPEHAYKEFIESTSDIRVVHFMTPIKLSHISSTGVRNIIPFNQNEKLKNYLDQRVIDTINYR